MKDRRIWVIIGCILVVGIAITSYTSSLVKEPEESQVQLLSEDTAQTAVGAAAPVEQDVSQKPQAKITEEQNDTETEADTEKEPLEEVTTETVKEEDNTADQGLPQTTASEKSGGSKETDPETEKQEKNETQVQGEPAALSAGQETEKGIVLTESPDQESYTDRLKNLDSQIQKMREQETDSNVYSAKTSAETELKMWDGELSVVYNALLEALPQEEALTLANEEKDWLKKRESDAADNSGKSGNSLSYASSMVSQTRERAYKLAKWCDELAGKN